MSEDQNVKSKLKSIFIPTNRKVRRLKGGLSKGMYMSLNLQSQFQRYIGLDERELLIPIKRLVSCCASLIDIGANDGYYTMAFLRSQAQRVIACEPGIAAEELLVNARINNYQSSERFTIERRLIGQEEGYLTVAELISNLPRPILLKVDVDGGEIGVLKSAESCSFLPELFWIIETHSLELEKQCIRWLQAHQYQVQVIRNAFWRKFIPEHRPLLHNRWLMAQSRIS